MYSERITTIESSMECIRSISSYSILEMYLSRINEWFQSWRKYTQKIDGTCLAIIEIEYHLMWSGSVFYICYWTEITTRFWQSSIFPEQYPESQYRAKYEKKKSEKEDGRFFHTDHLLWDVLLDLKYSRRWEKESVSRRWLVGIEARVSQWGSRSRVIIFYFKSTSESSDIRTIDSRIELQLTIIDIIDDDISILINIKSY